MIISSNIAYILNKPVSLLQLIHLIYIWRPIILIYNLNITQTWKIPLIMIILAHYFLHNICSMFHNDKKSKPQNCIIYWCWPELFTIKKIQYLFSEGLYRLASIFLSYSAASRFSFHSWRNAGWFISLIRGSAYALTMLIISYFLSLN